MKGMTWIIGVVLGFLIILGMIVGWGYIKQDLDQRADAQVVRHHNAAMEHWKDAGLIDESAEPLTVEELNRRRAEARARLQAAGGDPFLAARMAEEEGRVVTHSSATPRPAPPPPVESNTAGIDTQMMLLLLALGAIVVLTLGGIGGAVFMFARKEEEAAPH